MPTLLAKKFMKKSVFFILTEVTKLFQVTVCISSILCRAGFLQAMVKHEYFDSFDREKYNLFIQRSLAEMYLIVSLSQLLVEIFSIFPNWIEDGKILKSFVCDSIICQIDFVG